MDLETVRALFAYNEWANRRTLEGCESLSTDQLLEPLGGSFGSVRNTLAHIMDVEWLYLERWQGRSPTGLPDVENYPDLVQIDERWKTVDEAMREYVRALSQADIVRIVEFRNTRGNLFRHPLWETMQHLVNHSTYHRGQVTTLLRQLGGKPMSSDLIAFYRERSGQAPA
ncbi:MAG TPA: DinB family protein [Candidatus Limnocylindrales bacterium]|nr:DinB family protein [Candidatus Limnocylindrales bacterium]